MSFVNELESLPWSYFFRRAEDAGLSDVEKSLEKQVRDLDDFAVLISPAATRVLELLARKAHDLTVQRFGRVIQLYAPLYVSNECVDTCSYCGFSRDNPIVRRTLNDEEVLRETQYLLDAGFRHLLLVSGEHPRWTGPDYISRIIRLLHPRVPSISLEVAPQTEAVYRSWVQAGADGLVVYQETYDREEYAGVHLAGKKKLFDWRLETPERAARSGMKRIGIGILLGLADWREDALRLAAHARYLLKHFWKVQLAISLPRIRPAAGGFVPRYSISDADFVQLICALRMVFPDTGLVLSTRESGMFRDALIRIGVTHMSAGSRTEPGGYENPDGAQEQFQIEDLRTPAQVSQAIRNAGYEAVWKDWEAALND